MHMTSGSADYLVDTNIPLYAFDPTDRAKQLRAIDVLTHLEQRDNGALSVQILGEFFNIATHKLPQPLTPTQAEQSITNWARSWTVFDLTPLVVLEAIRAVQRYQFAYWDGLIWATAKLNGVPTVLSEDFNDGALIEGVRFLNPFRPGFSPAIL